MWSKPKSPPPSLLWTSPKSPPPPQSPTTSLGGGGSRPGTAGGSGPPTLSSSRVPFAGKRVAQVVRLKPEFRDRYREVHASVWPEVLRQIRACSIRDYSIFHDAETGVLFATFKYVGYDYAGDMERMRENPKVREWWAMTDGFQELTTASPPQSMVPGAKDSESGEPPWWKPLDEVFYTP
ncbi:hypothetical protein GGR56DRAFT_674572 [Xylariaceae sp. FL0804]|nr:hypothetical protein GGR56DRAFT_674572 [Xylariaceae sp. FL0804]